MGCTVIFQNLFFPNLFPNFPRFFVASLAFNWPISNSMGFSGLKEAIITSVRLTPAWSAIVRRRQYVISFQFTQSRHQLVKRSLRRRRHSVGNRFTHQLRWLAGGRSFHDVLFHWDAIHFIVRRNRCLNGNNNIPVGVWTVAERVIRLWAYHVWEK